MQSFYEEEIAALNEQLVHQQRKTAVIGSPEVPISNTDSRVISRIQPNIESEADVVIETPIDHMAHPLWTCGHQLFCNQKSRGYYSHF
jgi:hypothetical protein